MQQSTLPIVALALSLLCFAGTGCASTASVQAAPSASEPGGGQKHISVLLGERWLDDDDWSPVDDQTVIGIGFDMPLSSMPVQFEANLFRSKDESGSVEGITRELSAGVRKTFDVGQPELHPYVGGGLSLIKAEVDFPGGDDDDSSAALYIHGGAGWDLAPQWQIGVDLRFLFGSDIDLEGSSGDADYTQLALFVAYGF